ncbi:corrinoid-binding protein [Geothrix oryzae]|uniref:Corrinoid-binding protein n=1 Tax=Geothrix oryzae TaxID=2927975 RepID=A0ABM8DN13_9BACT|nr:cobalamin-dependent protein [Geothrix oryzae]BDU68310.1 corrinoid-binding protein [Geothrix oryzae]
MDRNYSRDLLEAIQKADRAGANAVVDAWAMGRSFHRVIPELLAPTLETFGKLWAQGTGGVSLATGYVASKVAEDVLSRLLLESASRETPALPAKGPVLVGNVEDDFHPLGRKMVAAFLRAAGWEVHDLGVDIGPAQFVDMAEETGARVIGASAMMFTTAKNVAKLRDEIDRRGLRGRLQLAVGGAVFKLRPELVEAFGGDGTAASAAEAPALFERLWQQALTFEPAPGGMRP